MKKQLFVVITIVFWQNFEFGASVSQSQQVPQTLASTAQPAGSPSAQNQVQPRVPQVIEQPKNVGQLNVLELTQEQQKFLPTLMRKTIWHIDGSRFKALSVSEENYIAVLNGSRLQVWDLRGKIVKIPFLDNRRIAAYSFALDHSLLVCLIDGGFSTISLQDYSSTCLEYATGSKRIPYAISQECYACIDERMGSVSIKLPSRPKPTDFTFGYTINLIAHDGQRSFALGNCNNQIINVVREGVPYNAMSMQTIPTALALSRTSDLYIGTRDGKVYRADAQDNWILFDTEIAKPVVFMAVFSDILMVMHEDDRELSIYSTSSHHLLYKLQLSQAPIKQIAVNRQGTVAYIDEAGGMGTLSLDSTALGSLSALSQQQKTVLQGLIRHGQQYDISQKVLQSPELAIVPQILASNIQKLSPSHIAETRALAPNGAAGPSAAQEQRRQSFLEALRSSWNTSATSMRTFFHNNPSLSSVLIASTFYLIVSQRAAIRKAPSRLSSWLWNLFKKPNRSRFLFF